MALADLLTRAQCRSRSGVTPSKARAPSKTEVPSQAPWVRGTHDRHIAVVPIVLEKRHCLRPGDGTARHIILPSGLLSELPLLCHGFRHQDLYHHDCRSGDQDMNEVTPRAFVFDAYGTLFDVHAAIARHRAAAGADADRFSELWRTKQLEYSWTLTLSRPLRRFLDLDRARARLRVRALSVGRPRAAATTSRRLSQARRLSGRARHRGRISRRAACTRRSFPMARRTCSTPPSRRPAWRRLLDAVLSVDAVRMYKPRPRSLRARHRSLRHASGGDRVRVVEPLGRHGRGSVRLSPALGQSRRHAGRICRAPAAARRCPISRRWRRLLSDE